MSTYNIINQLGNYGSATTIPAGQTKMIQSGGTPATVTVPGTGMWFLTVGLWATLTMGTPCPSGIEIDIDVGWSGDGGYTDGPRGPGIIFAGTYPGPTPPGMVAGGSFFVQGWLPNSPSNISGNSGIQGLNMSEGDTITPALFLTATAGEVIVEADAWMTWYLLWGGPQQS